MTRMPRFLTDFLLTPVVLAFALCIGGHAADLWVPATDPGVVTNNDCGQIAALSGRPLIRRSFQQGDSDGAPANIADRISSGDELVAAGNSSIEWSTGNNTVAVLAPGGRVRFDGLRTFTAADGREISRLDVTVLAGEFRAQARRNENRPEAVFASVGGAEFLLTRGDMELFAGDGWRCTALSGEIAGRLRRGAMPGAPFALAEGTVVDGAGESKLEDGAAEAVKQRIPFSFESARAALPPLPAMSGEMDAP